MKKVLVLLSTKWRQTLFDMFHFLRSKNGTLSLMLEIENRLPPRILFLNLLWKAIIFYHRADDSYIATDSLFFDTFYKKREKINVQKYFTQKEHQQSDPKYSTSQPLDHHAAVTLPKYIICVLQRKNMPNMMLIRKLSKCKSTSQAEAFLFR